MFKNMSFETLSQICRPIWLSFVILFVINGMGRIAISIGIHNFDCLIALEPSRSPNVKFSIQLTIAQNDPFKLNSL